MKRKYGDRIWKGKGAGWDKCLLKNLKHCPASNDPLPWLRCKWSETRSQTPVKIYLETFLLDTYNFSGWFPTAMPGFGLDSD